jgi:hypothetical protein
VTLEIEEEELDEAQNDAPQNSDEANPEIQQSSSSFLPWHWRTRRPDNGIEFVDLAQHGMIAGMVHGTILQFISLLLRSPMAQTPYERDHIIR